MKRCKDGLRSTPLRDKSSALTKTWLIVILCIVLGAGVSIYFFNAIVAGGGYPPFCSGYPPGGNCHANYSYTFSISINYSGYWTAYYRGFHNSEVSSINSNSNYTGGIFSGRGPDTMTVTLSGDNFHFLTLCAEAQKLDSSNSTLTLTVTGSNSTSLPSGSVYYCGGVAP